MKSYDPERLRPAIELILTAGRLPGLVLAIAQGDDPPTISAYGHDAAGKPLASASLFPVASITKLATALALLRLADTGHLALDDTLASHLPQAAAAQPGVTLRRLLSHSAGLPADLAAGAAPYAPGLNWAALAEACLATALQRPPYTYVQYGNVGYGLLALIIEQQTRLPFAAALADLVLTPLGIEAYLGIEPAQAPARLSGVRGSHVGSELEWFNSRFWRSLALPWAGLLTNAAGALALLRAFNGLPAGFLSPATLAEATSNQTGELGGGSVAPLIWPYCPWGLGPELRGAKKPHWSPPNATPDSFGHAGASGCVVWHAPQRGVSYAILGARTADSGWLVRHGAALGADILAE